ncbi:hypothetical protein J6590_046153 [Homalodisca vitripennis]|nr:hypothetical protein J6590_046153 [Homalodisca vitripennis]
MAHLIYGLSRPLPPEASCYHDVLHTASLSECTLVETKCLGVHFSRRTFDQSFSLSLHWFSSAIGNENRSTRRTDDEVLRHGASPTNACINYRTGSSLPHAKRQRSIKSCYGKNSVLID